MKITIACLADQGQAANGKLYLLGAGWTHVVVPPGNPIGCVLALMVELSSEEVGQTHTLDATLCDGEGNPLTHPSTGEVAVAVHGEFLTAQPPGLPAGTPILLPLIVQISPMTLAAGQYLWDIVLDNSDVDAELPFAVSFAAPPEMAN